MSAPVGKTIGLYLPLSPSISLYLHSLTNESQLRHKDTANPSDCKEISRFFGVGATFVRKSLFTFAARNWYNH